MTDSMRRMHTPQEIAAFASEKLNPSITKAQETADQANAIVAPEFSKTENYAAGAYVRHEGKLYRFAAPHSAGDWTGTDAVETTIAGPLASQASDITNHTARISLLQNDITGTYNGNTTYNTGDYCMKDYKLYKCKADGVTGAWDPTKWEEKTIMGETLLMGNIVDEDGHKRFQEWEMSTTTIEGVTFSFAKASLSGTHLMIVAAGSIQSGSVIAASSNLASIALPSWIMDKIVPVWDNFWIEKKTISFTADNWSEQTVVIALGDSSNTTLLVRAIGSLTATANRNFRIQFDLLID